MDEIQFCKSCFEKFGKHCRVRCKQVESKIEINCFVKMDNVIEENLQDYPKKFELLKSDTKKQYKINDK